MNRTTRCTTHTLINSFDTQRSFNNRLIDSLLTQKELPTRIHNMELTNHLFTKQTFNQGEIQ